ncbi:MAG: class I SAM-dependent methyltransferase family protein [Methanomassiliicoccales archaeon]|nr:class I SAM-dependent methyltransferase family protein [Methanomassiliicoccales archaeon]
MRLAKIPRQRAEAVRRKLFRLRVARKDLAIFEKGDHIFVPITDGATESLAREIGFEIVCGSSEEQACHVSPYDRILREIGIDDSLKSLLPWKWEMLGNVLVLRIPTGLEEVKHEVARKYAEVLGAKTVCEEVGIITGTYRTPALRVLYGTDTETVHLENSIRYKFDVARIMFSSGNIDERKRMGDIDCRGQTVVDMFAGIGYFSLPVAVHAGAYRVIACEKNPLAYGYLEENIRLNGVEDCVVPILGDNRELEGEGIADRIIMGYVGTTHEFLGKAVGLARPGCTVHYHEVCPIDLLPDRPLKRVSSAAGGRRHEILGVREVKSYGPSTSHIVVDFRILD